MTWKTLDEIEEDLSTLHSQIDSMGYSQARPAIKTGIALVWHLAQRVEELSARVDQLEKGESQNVPMPPDSA